MTRPLYDMFYAVPRRYDLVNHVITWGLDRRWRQKAAKECLTSQPEKVLDLCCGTGDLAIDLSRRSANGTGIIGLDYSVPMLSIAVEKTAVLDRRPFFIAGDASALPFPDRWIVVTTMTTKANIITRLLSSENKEGMNFFIIDALISIEVS